MQYQCITYTQVFLERHKINMQMLQATSPGHDIVECILNLRI